jgi:hypothetical protein
MLLLYKVQLTEYKQTNKFLNLINKKMADFSLTTLFVVPVGQTALPSSGSTQNLTAGQVGFFRSDYS